jgi:hypothetical protein
MRVEALMHEFVESAPDKLEEGKIYVSMAFATVLHKCCCGCGTEVVTPLSPTDWRITFDGETISLHPSVGNWSLQCQSHYWVERNKVRWAGRWSREEIEAGRAADRLAKKTYFDAKADSHVANEPVKVDAPIVMPKGGLWAWLRAWWSRLVG